MKLIPIGKDAIINPHHVSSVRYRLHDEITGPWGPVTYYITMYDGKVYEITSKDFNEAYPWIPIHHILQEMERS